MDKPREKCGIFGVYGQGLDASRLTYFGLYALQHRGQESSGIAASNGRRIRIHKNLGLVAQVYSEKDLHNLKGHMAIGHNRYSTSGGTFIEHTQPAGHDDDIVTLAHNGNLPSTVKLKRFLTSKNLSTKGLNDSGLMHKALKYFISQGLTLEEGLKNCYPLFTGAFCLLAMTKNKIAAVRDSYGIRPFSIGKLNGGYVFASETCALDTVNADFLRDVKPGEMVIIDKNGLTSYQLDIPNQKMDIFEFVYFARPDSMLLGKRVYKVRENLGKELAKEHPIKADVVIPVPDSSIPAALGYANASKIPFEHGLVKNRYIGRTFIMPDQKLRDRGVQMKLNPIPEIVSEKRVILIDDSIVRGTTSQKLVKMMREAGATQVHLLSSCPPVMYPDFYGIDTPTQQQLIGANKSIPQMQKFIGADSLGFLSYKGLIKATELPESVFCTSCFTGDYPIDIGKNKEKIKHIKVSGNGVSRMNLKKKLAVLISNKSQGTNLQAIIDSIENKKINAQISVVVSDEKDAYGLERAKKNHIKTEVNKDKNKLVTLLKQYSVDYIVLAGWKQFLTDEFIDTFSHRVLNLHPGLIPEMKDEVIKNPDGTDALWNRGKFTEKAIQNYFDKKATYAGSSVHLLTKDFDFGPVLGRTFEEIKKNDTIDSLYQRLKKKEHQLYIDVLAKLCN